MRGCARSVDGARPSNVTKKHQRSADGQAPQCNEEAGRGRRLGAEKILRPLVGLTKRSVEAVTKEEGEEAQIVSLSVKEGSRRPDPTRLGRNGSKGEDLKERLEVAEEESHHTLWAKVTGRKAT